MWSPISPIVANLLMEEYESKAFNTANNPPRLCIRYVNDNFVIQNTEQRGQFLGHISPIDPLIQLATEDPNTEGSMPFWTH